MSKCDEQRLNMIRFRTGQLRDTQAARPYAWLEMWNRSCTQLCNEHNDNGFIRWKIS